MAKIVEWEKEIEKLPERERVKIVESLKTLMSWQFFRKAFDGFGLKTIQHIAERGDSNYAAEDKK